MMTQNQPSQHENRRGLHAAFQVFERDYESYMKTGFESHYNALSESMGWVFGQLGLHNRADAEIRDFEARVADMVDEAYSRWESVAAEMASEMV